MMSTLTRRVVPLAARLTSASAAGVASGVVAGGPHSLGPLGLSAAVIGAVNALGFGISVATGSHYHLDLFGTGVFAASALLLRGNDLRGQVSAGAVALWAVKLSSFLVYRVFHTTHDARLDDTLSTTTGAFGFWAASFLWGWIVSLPHTLAATVTKGRPPFGGASDVLALAIFCAGLALETTADGQKWAFKQDPANRGKFCDVGVWRVSQHPNWLGNLMVWAGVLLLNTPVLLAPSPPGIGWLSRAGRLLAGASSPLFLLALFYGQASGSITNTVELANARYGSDPAYRAYVRDTPLVIPTSLRGLGARD